MFSAQRDSISANFCKISLFWSIFRVCIIEKSIIPIQIVSTLRPIQSVLLLVDEGLRCLVVRWIDLSDLLRIRDVLLVALSDKCFHLVILTHDYLRLRLNTRSSYNNSRLVWSKWSLQHLLRLLILLYISFRHYFLKNFLFLPITLIQRNLIPFLNLRRE